MHKIYLNLIKSSTSLNSHDARVSDRCERELIGEQACHPDRCYNSQENRGVIRDMCDVAVKVLSALSGLVFPHG